MHDENNIVRERQKAIRREMDRRGTSIKAVQLDGGWKDPSTVLSYFPANKDATPATMSVAALYRLIETKALPVDLLSLLLPDGFQIVQVAEGVDHERIAELAAEYTAKKIAAHRVDSEAGVDIGPNENRDLTATVVELRAAA